MQGLAIPRGVFVLALGVPLLLAGCATRSSVEQAQNSANSLNSRISMEMLTAQVTFQAQGKDYSVKLSTLANSQNQLPGTMSSQ